MNVIFFVGGLSALLLVMMLLFSIIFPRHRLWPVSTLSLFNQIWVWGLVATLFCCLIFVGIKDWNHFGWPIIVRTVIGGSLLVLSHIVVYSAALGIGIKATSGATAQLRTTGFYRFSRNPQYVGDMVMAIGWVILSASLNALLLASASLIVLILAPFAEESWMYETYGQHYLDYKNKVRRYI